MTAESGQTYDMEISEQLKLMREESPTVRAWLSSNKTNKVQLVRGGAAYLIGFLTGQNLGAAGHQAVKNMIDFLEAVALEGLE